MTDPQPPRVPLRSATRQRLPQLRDRLSLGPHALQVSPYCLGGVVGGPETVSAAFDAGINFFFITADLHWPFYENTRRGLVQLLERRPSVREEIVVVACSYVTHTPFVGTALMETLAAVPGLDYIDVLAVGGAHSGDLLPRVQFAHQLFGKTFVRGVAATLHDRKAARTAHDHRLVDLAYVRYNPSHPGARTDLFPHLDLASPTLVYNFKNTFGSVDDKKWAQLGLSENHWRPAMTDYYRFAMSQPRLDGLLCALGGEAEVAAFDHMTTQGPLDADEQEYLVDLVDLASGAAKLEPDQSPP